MSSRAPSAGISIRRASEKQPSIVMVFAPKGGVGKTTISTNLAVAAAMSGHSVGGLDFDTQRAFAAWGAERQRRGDAETLAKIDVREANLKDWRDELQQVRTHDVIVMDTPPRADGDVATFLLEIGRSADFIIMPVDVGPNSIRFVVDFMSWWKTKPTRAMFVLNKTIAGRTVLREARETLQTFGPVWEDSIPLRDDLLRMLDLGLGALDAPTLSGRENFASLWNFCSTTIGLKK